MQFSIETTRNSKHRSHALKANTYLQHIYRGEIFFTQLILDCVLEFLISFHGSARIPNTYRYDVSSDVQHHSCHPPLQHIFNSNETINPPRSKSSTTTDIYLVLAPISLIRKRRPICHLQLTYRIHASFTTESLIKNCAIGSATPCEALTLCT